MQDTFLNAQKEQDVKEPTHCQLVNPHTPYLGDAAMLLGMERRRPQESPGSREIKGFGSEEWKQQCLQQRSGPRKGQFFPGSHSGFSVPSRGPQLPTAPSTCI